MAMELSYNIAINDNFSIKPCVHYIQNSNFMNEDSNSYAFMIRASFRNGELYNNR